ncbi:MAG: hypothetical protein RMA76_09965 [Deltaproteobacteria bacterium]|jgi:transposase-like protein
MAKRESREIWTQRVERLMASDLTDTEFAAELGVNVHTLRSWKWKLGKTTKDRPRPERTKTPTPAPTFMEIVAPAPQPDLELLVGDTVRVRVPVGFDEDTLRRVLVALEVAR